MSVAIVEGQSRINGQHVCGMFCDEETHQMGQAALTNNSGGNHNKGAQLSLPSLLAQIAAQAVIKLQIFETFKVALHLVTTPHLVRL